MEIVDYESQEAGGFFKNIFNSKQKRYVKLTESLRKSINSLKLNGTEVKDQIDKLTTNVIQTSINAFKIIESIFLNTNRDDIESLKRDFKDNCNNINEEIHKLRRAEHSFYEEYKSLRERHSEVLSLIKELEAKKVKKLKKNWKILGINFNKKKMPVYSEDIRGETHTESEDLTLSNDNAKKLKALYDGIHTEYTSFITEINKSIFTRVNSFDYKGSPNKETSISENITFSNKVITDFEEVFKSLDSDPIAIFYDNDKYTKYCDYFYVKSKGKESIIKEHESGLYSQLLTGVPLIVQRILYMLALEDSKLSASILYSRIQALNTSFKEKLNNTKKAIIDNIKASFKDTLPGINAVNYNLIPYVLIIDKILTQKQDSKTHVKILKIPNQTSDKSDRKVIFLDIFNNTVALILEVIDVKETSSDDTKLEIDNNTIDVIIFKYMIKTEFVKLLDLLYSLSNNIKIVKERLEFVVYKLLNNNKISKFLGITDDNAKKDPILAFEKTRFTETITKLANSDNVSSDVFLLSDVSVDIINEVHPKLPQYSQITTQNSWHYNLVKKRDGMPEAKVLTSADQYMISSINLYGEDFICVNIYIPYLNVSIEERAASDKFKDAITAITTYLKAQKLDEKSIVMYASINRDLFTQTPSNIKQNNKPYDHLYIDSGIGILQVVPLSSSIYYFDYNIVEKYYIIAEKYTEDKRLLYLDFIIYKFPKSKTGYKLKVTKPYDSEIDIIVEHDKDGNVASIDKKSIITNINSIESPYEFVDEAALPALNIVTSDAIKKANSEHAEASKEHDSKAKELKSKESSSENTKDQLKKKTAELDSLKNDIKATLVNNKIFLDITKDSPPKSKDPSKDTDLDEIIKDLTDNLNDTTKLEKEDNGSDTLLKITGKPLTLKYNITKKTDDKTLNELTGKLLKYKTIYAEIEHLKTNQPIIDSEIATLNTDVEALKTQLDEKKKVLEATIKSIDDNKIDPAQWKYKNNICSNHQMVKFQLVKKDAAETPVYDEQVTQLFNNVTTTYNYNLKIDIQNYSDKYVKYIQLVLKLNHIFNGETIDPESFMRSVLDLAYYSKNSSMFYNQYSLFKTETSDVPEIVYGGRRSLRNRQNIKIKNEKPIPYNKLKLKRKTNKKGKYMASRRYKVNRKTNKTRVNSKRLTKFTVK